MSKVIRIDSKTEDLLEHFRKNYLDKWWDMEAQPNKEFFESDSQVIWWALTVAIDNGSKIK